MLTKEECLNELENSRYLDVAIVNQDGWNEWNGAFESTTIFKIFEQLTKEHFELIENFKQLEKNYDDLYDEVHNQKPLKFEELEVGMWVWDNKNHSWLKVVGFYGFNIHVQFGIGIHKNDCYVEYEENRFYRKQVKDDER